MDALKKSNRDSHYIITMETPHLYYDYLLKFLIIGDQAVGKTCLLLKFSEDRYASTHIATLGIDFKTKLLYLNDKILKLQIWDTAGQERFQNIVKTYYKGAMGIILAYDCTSKQSFANIKQWISQIQAHAKPDVIKVLVATKIDLLSDRVIYTREGQKLAEDIGILYFETSAVTGANIELCFTAAAQQIVEMGLCEKYGYTGARLGRGFSRNKRCC